MSASAPPSGGGPSTIRAKSTNGPPPRAELGEDEFGAAAVRLAGFASAMLGWSPDQFWGATPAELAAVAAALRPEAAAGVDAAELARLREAIDGG